MLLNATDYNKPVNVCIICFYVTLYKVCNSSSLRNSLRNSPAHLITDLNTERTGTLLNANEHY